MHLRKPSALQKSAGDPHRVSEVSPASAFGLSPFGRAKVGSPRLASASTTADTHSSKLSRRLSPTVRKFLILMRLKVSLVSACDQVALTLVRRRPLEHRSTYSILRPQERPPTARSKPNASVA